MNESIIVHVMQFLTKNVSIEAAFELMQEKLHYVKMDSKEAHWVAQSFIYKPNKDWEPLLLAIAQFFAVNSKIEFARYIILYK